MDELTTARTHLRPIAMDDLYDYHRAVEGDADVMKYLPGSAPRPLERTEQTIAFFIKHWEREGFGAWAVIYTPDNTLIGHCGLQYLLSTGEVELFYAIAKPYWGQGLTTEAARAVLHYGFDQRGFSEIMGVAMPENTASRRVMEKIGMTFYGITTRYYGGWELAHYALSDDAYWQSKSQSPAP
jgi:RimJ/RimL family protein N-acetyltransferase